LALGITSKIIPFYPILKPKGRPLGQKGTPQKGGFWAIINPTTKIPQFFFT